MLSSTTDTINTSPPVYFVLSWLWSALFGPSAASLRLFSAVTVAVALLLMFSVLKRAYGAMAASLALAVAFANLEILHQSVEARFYGLLLAEVALCILLFQKILDSHRNSKSLLAMNAAAHGILVMTHYFGLVYSITVLVSFLLTALVRRRNPVPTSLSIVAGWLPFLGWIPVLIRHLQMGKPTFWIPIPSTALLRYYYYHFLFGDISWTVAILCILAAGGIIFSERSAARRSLRDEIGLLPGTERTPLLIIGCGLGLVPLVIYLISIRPGGTSSFLARYFLPASLGVTIVSAHVAALIFRLSTRARSSGAAGVLYLARMMAVVFLVARFDWKLLEEARRTDTQPFVELLPQGFSRAEPLVIEDVQEFMTQHFYSIEPREYLFLVDLDAGVKAGGGGPANHQIMAGLRRQFPDRFAEVQLADEFLRHQRGFWVKLSKMHWFEIRVATDPKLLADFSVPSLGLIHVRPR